MKEPKALDRLIEYLNQNPGYYRPVIIGKSIGMTTHQTAVLLRYLADRGRINRMETPPSSDGKKGVTLYGVDREVGPTTNPRRNFYAAQREAASGE